MNEFYLDETILQSRTTLTLVDFVNELVDIIDDKKEFNTVHRIKIDEINIKYQRALKKRSRNFKHIKGE